MTDRPHYILKCPHFPGTITAEWFWLCVRSQCHQILRMRTFYENSCAISITSPRSLSSPRTQHVWWDHREKSRRASTLWDCRGKSRQTGPYVNAGFKNKKCLWSQSFSEGHDSPLGEKITLPVKWQRTKKNRGTTFVFWSNAMFECVCVCVCVCMCMRVCLHNRLWTFWWNITGMWTGMW